MRYAGPTWKKSGLLLRIQMWRLSEVEGSILNCDWARKSIHALGGSTLTKYFIETMIFCRDIGEIEGLAGAGKTAPSAGGTVRPT